MQLTKLHESLFILFKCSRTVDRVQKALEEHRQKGILRSRHHYSHNLAYYVIMEADSFLDEYNRFFTKNHVEPEYKERVQIVREVLKPLVKKINDWKDLSLYRDNIVAHGWRDKKDGKKLVAPHLKSYDIPRTSFEFLFLNDLIKSIFHVINEEFKTEVDQALWFGYKAGEVEPRPDKDYADLNLELQQILDEMNKISQLYSKNYDIQITGYKFSEKDETEELPCDTV